MRLDAKRSKTLHALIQALATIPRDVANEATRQSRAVIAPEWKKTLSEHAGIAGGRIFFDRLVKHSSVEVSHRNVRLNSGKDGLFPRETEFGAYREEYNTYRTKHGSTTRRTQRQFHHFVGRRGRVNIPARAEMIPRAAALWAQTAYRTIAERIEGVLRPK